MFESEAPGEESIPSPALVLVRYQGNRDVGQIQNLDACDVHSIPLSIYLTTAPTARMILPYS